MSGIFSRLSEKGVYFKKGNKHFKENESTLKKQFAPLGC